MDDGERERIGVGILEQLAFGDHQPTGLKGVVAGYQPS
jgi:hypothetical protein